MKFSVKDFSIFVYSECGLERGLQLPYICLIWYIHDLVGRIAWGLLKEQNISNF